MRLPVSALRLFVIAMLPFAARAQEFTFLGDYRAHAASASSVTITAANNAMRITAVDSSTVRIEVGRDGRFIGTASHAVEERPRPPVALDVRDERDMLVITLPGGVIEVLKRPLRLRFLAGDGRELCADDPAFGHGWRGNEVATWKTLHKGERFFGLGEKTGNLDKRGDAWVMWNTDHPAYAIDHDPLYVSVPFFVGVHDAGSYGIFFDNSHRAEFNLGAGGERCFSFGAPDGAMTWYFFFGPDIGRVVAQYAALTGRMPLPPRWALGFQQCRWNYRPASDFLDVARNFRERRIPADVLYLDIGYMDRFKVFTWDTVAFPRPGEMLADLRARGFSVVTIVDPGVKVERGYDVFDEGESGGMFAAYMDGAPYAGVVWPGWCRFPDFTRPATRSWWGRQYARMFDMGVSGFWNDMNEPAVWGREMPSTVRFDDDGRRSSIGAIHNVYAHLEARASYEGLRAHAPGVRPFLLSRAAFAGSQRYTAVWTGDNVASYEHLALAVRMCLGLGLSGMPFVGADIGGFMGAPTPELYARWMQAGVFTPLFRSHAVMNSPRKEPWSFGESIETNARDCIALRYQLMPYIYTEFRNASRTGIPMMRPLFLDHQNDTTTFHGDVQHEFLFGPNILAAPVVNERQYFQKVYLPRGEWLDPSTDILYRGGQHVIVEAPWWKLPYFFRAGGIVPRRETVQYDDERPLTDLIVDVVAGADGAYTLYLDGGDGFEYENGRYDEVRFSLVMRPRGLEFSSVASDGPWASGIARATYRFRNMRAAPVSVSVNGVAVDIRGDATEYDASRNVLVLRLPFRADETKISITW